ncbi:glycosyltransferase family 2 protein [Bacteroides reticulotermitis]|uniref:glycosyltransferase family 2 protein n=1 Tax=Bacteroides reticulotermitis TaxID=1133319 RepID=UPI003A88F60E
MENSSIKISVIMPVYNSGEYLKTAVESILSQSLREIELILVDDGSTDGTSERCNEFASIDKRVRVIHQRNAGICNARNAALRIAIGEYLAFSDHDDEYLPELLRESYRAAVETGSDIVKFSRKELLIRGNSIIREKHIFYENKTYNKKEIVECFFSLINKGALTCVWDGIYRRSNIVGETNLFFDEYFKNGGEDIAFMMNFIQYANSLTTLSSVYYMHYIRKGVSTSTKFSAHKIKHIMKLPFIVTQAMETLKIDLSEKERDYSFYLIKEYLCPIINIYANPNCLISKREKIRQIEYLAKQPFIDSSFLKQNCCWILKYSKKIGIVYFLYKYRMFNMLLKVFQCRQRFN